MGGSFFLLPLKLDFNDFCEFSQTDLLPLIPRIRFNAFSYPQEDSRLLRPLNMSGKLKNDNLWKEIHEPVC